MQFTAQQTHYGSRYPNAVHCLILKDGRPVGRVYVSREEEVIRILDITVLPAERSAGIGTTVLEEIMDDGRATGRPVQIYVENYNPSLKLFERLGFSRIEDTGMHYLMELRPSP
jgi:ribosomal protein S18 acetylase RimI-like enzyme